MQNQNLRTNSQSLEANKNKISFTMNKLIDT